MTSTRRSRPPHADRAAELAAYKTKLKALRGLPLAVKEALAALPANAHPMDVMRTGVSALGCALPEKDDHASPGARDIADRLIASLGSIDPSVVTSRFSLS